MKQGWEIKKLGEVATYVNGYAFKPEHWVEKGTPIIRIQNLNNPDASYNYCDFDIPSKYIVERGDILISWSASLGVYEWEHEKGYLNQHIFKVVFDKGNINKYYLKYAVSAKISDMLKNLHGATMKHIVKKDFDNTLIPVPPIAEQEKIVAELDCLSGIIEKKKQQLKELDNLVQSIFYEMFGDPVENDKGWEVKKIGEVCIVERGGSPRPINAFITDDENGVNWIKIGDATEGSRFITSTKEKIIPEGVRKSGMVKKGDFILSNSMSFGRPYIMGIDGCIHDGWLVLRDKDNVFDKTYLYYYLGSSHVYQEFKRLAVGGVVNNLNSELVRGVRVAIPSFSVQQEFASKIESIEKQKELIAQSIKETETLFNSRMDYYFN